jgi:hypothetical protein
MKKIESQLKALKKQKAIFDFEVLELRGACLEIFEFVEVSQGQGFWCWPAAKTILSPEKRTLLKERKKKNLRHTS